MAQRAPLRPTSRIEEAIGFVGCSGLLFFGVTVFCELTGRPALAWALTLLGTVVTLVLLDRWRRRVLRRHEETSVHRPAGSGATVHGPTIDRPAAARAEPPTDVTRVPGR
jgi:hypothetical protein